MPRLLVTVRVCFNLFVVLCSAPSLAEQSKVEVLTARGEKEITGNDGAPMMLVPAGEFMMGSDEYGNEKPLHRVYLDAFYMDKYEVTTSRYVRFLEATGREQPFAWKEMTLASHGDRPVTGVDWYDADDYCRWVGKRLPSEAEWEKAARGTVGRTYPWGDEEPTSRHANFNKCCEWKGYETLTAAGSLEAGMSQYGIYDMAGNVWEWVADWYEKSYYQGSPDRNPKGPPEGVMKVIRGGAWDSSALFLRSAFRLSYDPPHKHFNFGFRCAGEAR